MDNETETGIWLVFFGVVVGSCLTWFANTNYWKTDAIRHNYAQYCPISGNWAWNGECDDK